MRVLDEQTINERLIADFCARTGLSNLRASGRIAHMFGSVARQLGVAYNAAWAIRDSWFWGSCGESDAEGLRRLSDNAQSRLQDTADFHEGAVAFVEKRAPRWLGK